MKSDQTIKKNLRDLRDVVENSHDPILEKVAYAMETAIRWAREDTVGWPSMLNEAIHTAMDIKKLL